MRHQMFINRHRQGPYYVRYHDGQETGLMEKGEAKNLADIFGGELLHDPEGEAALKKLHEHTSRSERWQQALIILIVLVVAILIFHN